ncbi:phage terminase large subunit [Sphingomonas profundi]|uniref:phage terminase large subunit n=1 Tax=Alterirhizorhabdus profundi TaxID=2681549 RepID=UPI0012E92DAF|nr:phage terminase large subunit [Sphingomonas profundi]
MSDVQDAFRLACRQHLSMFIDRTFREVSPADRVEISWYLQAVAYHLELCARREIRRLIINIPPRHGKSISASVAFIAWLLGHNPAEKVVGISYASDLALKFARDTKRVMESRWYRAVFPGTRLGGRAAVHDFETTRRGSRYTTSIDGALTGLGGNIFVVDDPNQASDARSAAGRAKVIEWYRDTLVSRANNARQSVIIVVQQRVHVEDLSGHLLESEPGDWVHLNLPAIATRDEAIAIGPDRWHQRRVGDLLDPIRETRETLEQRRRSMTSQIFSAQFQQDPVPEDGEIIKWGWFKRYATSPIIEEGDRFVQSWDTASKAGELNDFSVCTTWFVKGRDYYLLDVWRGRVTFPDLKRQVYALAARWGIDQLLIEDKGSGTQLIAQLEDEDSAGLPRPIARVPKEDKVTRMSAQSVWIEQGHVHIPAEAPWLATFQSEMLQFPSAKHDDQVDSVSQFLMWVTERPETHTFFMFDFHGNRLI